MQIVMAAESGFAGDGYFAMAGYVTDHQLWAAFDPYWNAVLGEHGVDHFHMKDFAHARGAFEGWNENRRRALMADLLEIVTSAPIRAIGACLKISDFTALESAAQRRFIGPYAVCFQEMVLGTGLVGADSYPLSRIDFVYSQQDEFKRHMKGIWTWSKENRDYGRRLGHLAFLDMRKAPGLQAADLLVYEFRHAYHLKDTRPDLPRRYPWQRLLEHQETNHYKTLKYLPGWMLRCQADGVIEEVMDMISTDYRWDDMYEELNPGFSSSLRRQGRLILLLDKYVRYPGNRLGMATFMRTRDDYLPGFRPLT